MFFSIYYWKHYKTFHFFHLDTVKANKRFSSSCIQLWMFIFYLFEFHLSWIGYFGLVRTAPVCEGWVNKLKQILNHQSTKWIKFIYIQLCTKRAKWDIYLSLRMQYLEHRHNNLLWKPFLKDNSVLYWTQYSGICGDFH